MPVVILPQHILGGGPPDEDPDPPFGNPHPLPNVEHFHPNQENHFVGPIPVHMHIDDNMDLKEEPIEEHNDFGH